MKCTACGAWTRATPWRPAPTASRSVTSPPTRCRRFPLVSPPDWLSLLPLHPSISNVKKKKKKTLWEPEGLCLRIFSDLPERLLSVKHLINKHWSLTLRLKDLTLCLIFLPFLTLTSLVFTCGAKQNRLIKVFFFFKSCLNHKQICSRPFFYYFKFEVVFVLFFLFLFSSQCF